MMAGCSEFQAVGSGSSSLGSAAVVTANVQLTWQANAAEQDGFYVLQSTDGKTFTKVQTVMEPSRTATVAVVAGQLTYFQVQGFNQAGTSVTAASTALTAP